MTRVFRATRNGAQTSVAADWLDNTNTSGVPTAGSTVAANGFSGCVIDSNLNIGGANNVTVNAGSFVSGVYYQIVSVGSTNWTAIGASSPNPGVVFQATGAGSGTGQAITQAAITTTAAGAAIAGGGFVLSGAFALQADIRAGSTPCLAISGSNNYTFSGVRILGGSVVNAHGASYTGSGTVAITGGSSVIGGSAATAHGFNANGTGLVRVDAGLDIKGGSGSGAGPAGINFVSGSGEIINGTIVNGGTTSSSTVTPGIAIASGVTVTINNSIVNGGSANAANYGISCLGTLVGSVNVFTAGSLAEAVNASGSGFLNLTNCTYNASATMHAIVSANSITHVLGGAINDEVATGSGVAACYVRRSRDGAGSPSSSTWRRAGTGAAGNSVTLYGLGAATLGYPVAADVRLGTVYGQAGQLTGTLQTTITQSPSVQQISDQLERTGGLLDLTLKTNSYTPPLGAQGFRDALGIASPNLDIQLSGVNSNINSRLAANAYTPPPAASDIAAATVPQVWNYATRELSNSGVQAIRSGLSTLSALDVRTSVWVDATNRSLTDRTGFSLTSAERDAISNAVQSSILNENDGQQILNAIVGAIGNQNIDQVALVAAIRADLERFGGKIDTRLAATSYTPPPAATDNAAAVWSSQTRTITGGTVNTLVNAPTVPTPQQITDVVWSHVDRTLTNKTGYELSPDSAQIIAEAVRQIIERNGGTTALIKAVTDALNTQRLANVATTEIVTTALVAAIGS